MSKSLLQLGKGSPALLSSGMHLSIRGDKNPNCFSHTSSMFKLKALASDRSENEEKHGRLAEQINRPGALKSLFKKNEKLKEKPIDLKASKSHQQFIVKSARRFT